MVTVFGNAQAAIMSHESLLKGHGCLIPHKYYVSKVPHISKADFYDYLKAKHLKCLNEISGPS